jgi:hypothetical protein
VAERNAEPVAHVSATLCGAVRSGARQLGELVTLVIIDGACVSACSLAIGCCRARAGLDRPNAVLGILGSAFMPLGGQRQSVTQSVTRHRERYIFVKIGVIQPKEGELRLAEIRVKS